jgi:SAM-dependent methyltransferase
MEFKGPLTEERKYPADLCLVEGGVSRIDRMDPEEQGRVIEMLESRASDPDMAELRSRFFDMAGIAGGQRIVDVGCGTGADTRSLASRARPTGSVLGIDPSEILLREARRRTPPDLPARYERASGEKIPLASESVDRAVAITTLSHVPDPRPVVAEMVRVTRAGGRISLLDHDMGTFVVDAANREITGKIFSSYTRAVSGMDAGRRLHGLLKEAGLRGIRVAALPFVDIRCSGYFRFIVDRYPDQAVADGVIAEADADAWRRDVRARAEAGRFFGSVVYFGAVGLK